MEQSKVQRSPPSRFHGSTPYWRDPSVDCSQLLSRPPPIYQKESSKVTCYWLCVHYYYYYYYYYYYFTLITGTVCVFIVYITFSISTYLYMDTILLQTWLYLIVTILIKQNYHCYIFWKLNFWIVCYLNSLTFMSNFVQIGCYLLCNT